MGTISFLFEFGYIIFGGGGGGGGCKSHSPSHSPLDILVSYIPYMKMFYIALLSYAIVNM